MSESFFFADHARGIYAARSGAIYVCTPGTFDLIASPLILPPPFRVVTHDSLDPYFVVFTQSGHLHAYSMETNAWTLKLALPPIQAVIRTVALEPDGLTVTLGTTKGTFQYQGGWTLLSEPLDALLSIPDQRFTAQAAVLENDIAVAVRQEKFDVFEKAVSLYLGYLANLGSPDVFVAAWYALIGGKYPFDGDAIAAMWERVLEELAGIDRIARFIEELRISLHKHP
jgi:hypothetical protein